MHEKENSKMTLEEYKQNYSSPYNQKAAKAFLVMLISAIGITLVIALTLLVFKCFEIHKITGYISIAVAVIVFILIFIVPLCIIFKSKAFITDIDEKNIRHAKRFNRELRKSIADHMIDISKKVENNDWYSKENIERLIEARNSNREQLLNDSLNIIFETDVKKTGNKMVGDCVAKVGLTTAVSQSEQLDVIFVLVYQIKLIKDLVYLYGYRPNDRQMNKIFKKVLINALLACGVQSVASKTTAGITKLFTGFASSFPFLGNLAASIIESSAQGILNGALTFSVAIQTKKFLKEDYHLQDIIDNIEISEEINEK